MTVVIGTAGHIDHGKTSLLRALTGIDADRLPEEKTRGMTIDIGYAHLALPSGDVLDFVDVPGHDRLIGNMLVGAGEIDAALLVVAAADGPRAQTLEHLALLDALAIDQGLVAITKWDLLAADDARRRSVRAAVEMLLTGTSLAGSNVVAVSATTGEGLAELRAGLQALHDLVRPSVDRRDGPPRLAVDRVFTIRGHGAVVTGSLRGGQMARGQHVRIEPGGIRARVREIQVRNEPAERSTGGRTALNLAGVETADLRRGMVVVPADDDELIVTDRILVALRGRVPGVGGVARLHVGTAEVGAVVGRGARERAETPDGLAVRVLRLVRPVATLAGERVALRASSPGSVAGGRIIDPDPPRGPSRRRSTTERLLEFAAAGTRAEIDAARLDLHGAAGRDGTVRLATDVTAAIDEAAVGAVAAHHAAEPASAGLSLADLRPVLARELRRRVAIDARSASRAVDTRLDALVGGGKLARDGDRLRDPAREAGLPAEVSAAMDRLVARLAVNDPPPLAACARETGCPPDGVRALETEGRIVRVETDLAYAASTFAELVALAVTMARRQALTPAAFRDATGTSRRYVMTLLEDFDRRGILTRTAAGHVPGPRAPAP